MSEYEQFRQAIFDAVSEALSQLTPEEIYELTFDPYRSLIQEMETA